MVSVGQLVKIGLRQIAVLSILKSE